MYFPKAFIGMIVALVVVAAGMHVLSGSPGIAIGATLATWLLLQLGYFLVTTGMVVNEHRRRARAAAGPSAVVSGRPEPASRTSDAG